MTQQTVKVPHVTFEGEDVTPELVREINAILYALALIRHGTGHGALRIEIKDGRIGEMEAAHSIRPKYLQP